MLGYYQIRSPLSAHSQELVYRFISRLQDEMGEVLKQLDLREYLEADFALIYVASGGSEGYFLEIFEQIKHRHCYILTSGDSNSLAASMEILSFLNKHGGSGEILHGDIGEVAARITAIRRAHEALKNLRGKRLGCIGTPSDWLIASDYDADAVMKKLGLGFVSIGMDELLSEIARHTYADNEYTELLKRKDFDKTDVEKALCVYGAFQRIVERYDLAGVSVRCFDLLDSVHTTGCLGLSILNNLGVYGGCEGDMPALLSMAVMGSVTGEKLFMCNPSRFDTKEGSAVFAHCTVPTDMLSSFKLNTHFESGIGVAVQGKLPEGDCTIFKCEGD
ncbi:MAG: hypothetical protein II920_09310, partial [Clostridia bacterium]|nr:hypothetical protein [Clostridia bacterium]